MLRCGISRCNNFLRDVIFILQLPLLVMISLLPCIVKFYDFFAGFRLYLTKKYEMLRFGISMRDYIKPQLTALWILLKFFPCNVIHASKTATSYGFHFSGYITWNNNNNKVTGCDHFWHCVLHNIPKTLLFRRGFTKYPNVLIFSSGNCKHKYCNIQWEKYIYNINIVLTLPSAGLDSA